MAKYSDHPLYHLRMLLIVSAAIGVFLCFCSGASSMYSYELGPFLFACLLLFISGLLAFFDLVAYKVAKATDPDNEPKWPLKKYFIGDIILAVIMQWFFWPLVASISFSYANTVLEAYASLPLLISSILHGICFWKELMARKKAQWLKSQPLLPCTVCGAFTQGNDTNLPQPVTADDEIEDLRARFFKHTPDDTSNESEVLIQTEDFDSGYGAIGGSATRVTSPNKPRSSKGKGKRPL